jgi:glycosyltransferase involved in cell wall biosynthesis
MSLNGCSNRFVPWYLPFLGFAAREHLEYDATVLRWLLATAGVSASALLWMRRDKDLAFHIMSRVHRFGGSKLATASIERALARAHARERNGERTGLWRTFDAHIQRSVGAEYSAPIVKNAKGLLNYRVLVLKSPRDRERGVIAMDYSYIFPLFAALFDIEQIARKYYLVLEPSWRGVCTADILSYSKFDFPVFVESIEPRDTGFLERLKANFITAPIAANWWVDHRLVKPDPSMPRDLDVIMVAAWSSVKRHWRFFRVLAELRRRGHTLRVALVGYEAGKTRAAIEAEARRFGVLEQLEIHDSVSMTEVVKLLTRSKVHLLWSRKEGANRAIVEALFADVPIILREGLSYGHHYPYVNPSTGRFASEDNLGDVLLDMTSRYGDFRPREWALANMSCQRATEILEDTIRPVALAAGEQWTSRLAVKTVHLEKQAYWDPEDLTRFADDYTYLQKAIRKEFAM